MEEDGDARTPPPPRDMRATRPYLFYEASALLIIWSVFIIIDAIDQYLAFAPRNGINGLTATRDGSFVPSILPIITAVTEGILGFIGFIQGILALVFQVHFPRTSAYARLLHIILSLFILVVYLISIDNVYIPHPPRVSLIFGALATFALRSSLLFVPFDFSSQIDWPCVRPSIRSYFSNFCIFLTGFFLLFSSILKMVLCPDEYNMFPVLSFLVAALFAFFGLAGMLITYSGDSSLARVHIIATVPVAVIGLVSFVIVHSVMVLGYNQSVEFMGAFYGSGPPALAVLIVSSLFLPAYFLQPQAEKSAAETARRNRWASDDVIEINYP